MDYCCNYSRANSLLTVLEHNGLTWKPDKFLEDIADRNPLTVISFLRFFFCVFCEGVGKSLRIAHVTELRLPVVKKVFRLPSN